MKKKKKERKIQTFGSIQLEKKVGFPSMFRGKKKPITKDKAAGLLRRDTVMSFECSWKGTTFYYKLPNSKEHKKSHRKSPNNIPVSELHWVALSIESF